MNFVSYAQNFEDVLLWRALRDVENGFYIDVGAQDPVTDSVSLSFYERGWRGVHIEASPQYAAKLRKCRPDEIVIEAVVGATPGRLTFFEVRDTGLGTADPETAESHRSAGYEVTERIVESRTLTQLLSQFSGREIHWMKIDVEGLEREVIEGWDAGLNRPWIVIIEATKPLTEQEAHDSWESLIFARGYDFAFFDGLNRYYVSRDHGELVRRISCPANVFDKFELSGGASNTFTKGLERRISELARLETELGSARELQASMRSELEALRQKVQDRDDEIVRLESTLALHKRVAERAQALAEKIEGLDVITCDLQENLKLAQAKLLAAEKSLADREAEIEAVYRSKSWRLTQPLRSVSANFTKAFTTLRARF